MIGFPFTRILVTSDGEKAWWCNLAEDINAVGEYLIPHLMKAAFSREYYRHYQAVYTEIKRICEKIRKEGLSGLSPAELSAKYEHLYGKLKRYHALSFDIDAIDIVLEQLMKQKFEKLVRESGKGLSQKEISQLYNSIKTPSELSYVNEEQRHIYELAGDVQQSLELKRLFEYDTDMLLGKIREGFPQFWSRISALAKEYWWTSLGWTVRKEKTEKDFVEDIKNILRENPDIQGELRSMSRFIEKTACEKIRIAREFRFDSEMNAYVAIFEKYAALHDCRKEIQMKGTMAMNRFLFEIAGRYSKKFDDLVWSLPSEIQCLLRTGSIDIETSKSRKEAWFMLVTKLGIQEETGELAIKRRKEELNIAVSQVYDFKGQSASLGKAAGKAKVCYSASEAMQKVRKGDILVASMTTPDYLPAMKKASAIITDEGGVTCHAAIISGELGIPCIVGTRVATEILQDDELIEVNANHGVIKRIGNMKNAENSAFKI